MVDRFEELRTYIAVVETGGVNAAAAKLGIARSAISRRLSDLEARLGSTLVERNTRRFELTSAGQRYYSESKRVIDELARIDASIGGGGIKGSTIVIDCAPALVAAVADGLAGFLRKHPEHTLRIVHASKRDRPSLSISSSRQDGAREIGYLAPIVVCAPAYLDGRDTPNDLADLAGHVAITVEGSTAGWTSRSGARVAPTTAVTVGDDASALALAAAGAGLALLPRSMCAPALAAGRLVEALPALQSPAQPIFALATDNSAAALLDHLAAHTNAD